MKKIPNLHQPPSASSSVRHTRLHPHPPPFLVYFTAVQTQPPVWITSIAGQHGWVRNCSGQKIVDTRYTPRRNTNDGRHYQQQRRHHRHHSRSQNIQRLTVLSRRKDILHDGTGRGIAELVRSASDIICICICIMLGWYIWFCWYIMSFCSLFEILLIKENLILYKDYKN